MTPNTFGGGLGVCGRGGRTWRAELSHQCRKIGDGSAKSWKGSSAGLLCLLGVWGSKWGVRTQDCTHSPGAATRAPHTKTWCCPKHWSACEQLCLKWTLGNGCNTDRINTSTFTRVPLPFPTNNVGFFLVLPVFLDRLSSQYTIDAFVITENTVRYVKCQSECFLCLCDGGLNLEQGT